MQTQLPKNWKPCEVEQGYLEENIYDVNGFKRLCSDLTPTWFNYEINLWDFLYLALHTGSPVRKKKQGKIPSGWDRCEKSASTRLINDWTCNDTNEYIRDYDPEKEPLFGKLYLGI